MISIQFGLSILPAYGKLVEETVPIIAKNYSVSGKLYVDYRSVRRRWRVSWGLLSKADYNTIKTEYDRQFSSSSLQPFTVTGDITVATNFAFMEIDKIDHRWSSSYIKDFGITIEEQEPV
jgi:hypothetical protein